LFRRDKRTILGFFILENTAMEFLKQLFCKHSQIDFVRNIYGDEINHFNGNRSLLKCKECGKYILKQDLYYG